MFDLESDRSNKSKFWRLRNDARLQPQPWHWPLARFAGRDPIVLGEYATDVRRGLDLGYLAGPLDALLHVPVYAAQAGEVVVALEGPHGFYLSIDHGKRISMTHYAHLSKLFVTACRPRRKGRQFVRAGEVIGHAARSPLHVRFELWRWNDEREYVAVDPRPELAGWTTIITPTPVCEPATEAA